MAELSLERQQVYKSVEVKVGNIPLVEVTRIPIPNGNRIFAMEEYRNPTGSNFDRIYIGLFRKQEEIGRILPGLSPTIEVTTGNAGASFAWTAHELGYGSAPGRILRLVLPSDENDKLRNLLLGRNIGFNNDLVQSMLIDKNTQTAYPLDLETRNFIERGFLPLDKPLVVIHADAPAARAEHIQSLGARVLYSPSFDYTEGYLQVLETFLALDRIQRDSNGLGQRLWAVTKNEEDARFGYFPLVGEAYTQLERFSPDHPYFDYYFSVVGSGDCISGIGERLKQIHCETQVIAIEDETQVLSALRRGQFTPKIPISKNFMFGSAATGTRGDKLNIHWEFIDEVEQVTTGEWQFTLQELFTKEGQHIGRTSAAEFAAALHKAQQVKNCNLLFLYHDPGWKYTDNYAPKLFKA